MFLSMVKRRTKQLDKRDPIKQFYRDIDRYVCDHPDVLDYLRKFTSIASERMSRIVYETKIVCDYLGIDSMEDESFRAIFDVVESRYKSWNEIRVLLKQGRKVEFPPVNDMLNKKRLWPIDS